jgi:hypothetical protein
VLHYQLRVTHVTDYRDELCCDPYQGYAEHLALANGQQMIDRRKEDRAWDIWAMMRIRLQNGAWVYVVFAGLLILLNLM